ncbi:hypothetical protein [Rhizobium leguminosarum]
MGSILISGKNCAFTADVRPMIGAGIGCSFDPRFDEDQGRSTAKARA